VLYFSVDIHIVTIFPEVFSQLTNFGIFRVAREKGAVNIFIHNLRDYTTDKHKSTDDRPYGGGAGMVMLVKPVSEAIESLKASAGEMYKVLITPQGEKFDSKIAEFLSGKQSILLFPAHYEGLDERASSLFDMELSVGDFVVSGGEIPALLIMDAVVRLIPGVLGNEESLSEESFANNLLEYPHYTRPEEFKGEEVPEVLRSGNHEKIRLWRLKESLRRTLLKRPDLVFKKDFTKEEKKLLKEIKRELEEMFEEIFKK
jgi:tRNA (guanine37-N1)-methyltransferase